ncbi:MAG: hypothetical protein EOO77_13360 [Oxalobacteraceae bacterium]|nr:MAG: hypothetical protein EOO77_13360 [Oxalobacteraceae bacterium]
MLLSDKAVACLVKGAAEGAGFDPERYSGLFMPAWLLPPPTPEPPCPAFMRQTRHKSTQVALL